MNQVVSCCHISWCIQQQSSSHLELVRDLRHKGGDLLHEPVHAALTARLQQGGDGQSGNAAVRIRDQVLQVQVACSHSWWMLHGNLAETKTTITSKILLKQLQIAGISMLIQQRPLQWGSIEN